MSFFKSIGRGIRKGFKAVGSVAKKALPFAAMALPFIPGVGPALGGAFKAVTGAAGSLLGMGGSAGDDAYGPPSWAAGSGPQQMPPTTIYGSQGFPWGSAVGALGSAASGYLGFRGQQSANASNAQMAQQQMDFQERMSSSSYQRGVQDLRAAGLNPMLAYSQGGASSPGGSTAQMGNEIGAGMSSALGAVQALTSIENVNSQTDFTRAQTANALATAEKIQEEIGATSASAEYTRDLARNVRAGLPGTEAESAYKRGSLQDRLKGTRSHASLAEYELSGARNRSQYQDTWVGRNISPFLHDALQGARAIGEFR